MLTPANNNNAGDSLSLEATQISIEGYASNIHTIMNPGSNPGVKTHTSIKSHIIDPRLIPKQLEAANDFIKMDDPVVDSSSIEVEEDLNIPRGKIIEVGIRLLNQDEIVTLEEIPGLFSDILKNAFSDEDKQKLRIDGKREYTPIESAAYLDNAFSLLEQERREKSPEYRLLLIWQEVMEKILGVPDGKRSFESMARMLERLSNNKKRA